VTKFGDDRPLSDQKIETKTKTKTKRKETSAVKHNGRSFGQHS